MITGLNIVSTSLNFDPDSNSAANKPWIGISLSPRALPLNEPYRKNGSDFVVRVHGIEPGSPSEVAGIRVGDLVGEIDGTSVDSVDQAIQLLKSKSIGQVIGILLMRADEQTSVELTVGVDPKRPFDL
jgi:S1-C subfamily serine protease